MSKEEWAAHVKAWRQGDVSAAVYCEKHDLKLSTLRYWASRIKDGAKPRRVRMARVKTTPAKSPKAMTGALRLISLEIPSGFDGDALERVLASLGAKQ